MSNTVNRVEKSRKPKAPKEIHSTPVEAAEISGDLAKIKGFPAGAPVRRSDAWYRNRRAELQRQKVELLAKYGKKAA